MQLHGSCTLCLLSLASRYPHCWLGMNEVVLGAQSVPTEGWTSSELIEYFQRTMPEVLEEQALLVLGAQENAIYLLDRSLDTPAMSTQVIETVVSSESNDLVRAVTRLQDGVERIEKSSEQVAQQALIERILRGDIEAFGAIVDQYHALMMRKALLIVGDRDIAADAVQDALIQAWQHLSSLRETGALRPWLMRIVANQCINYKRKAARTSAFVRQSLVNQSIQLAADIADDQKGRLERDWDLAETVKKLSPKQQAVIMLHYYQGMTLPSMAQALQISENTLKRRIQAALNNLRQVLRPDDNTEAFGALR